MNEISTESQETAKQVQKENRQIITPYAFQVSPDLFGKPLASPTRRGLAILIDLFCVGLLSGISGNALAVLTAALMIFVSGRLKRKGKPAFLINLLRSLGILMILLAMFGFYDQFQQSGQQESAGSNQHVIEKLAVGGAYLYRLNQIPESIETGECDSKQLCLESIADDMAIDLSQMDLTDNEATIFMQEFAELISESLTPEQAASFTQRVLDKFEPTQPLTNVETEKSEKIEKLKEIDKIIEQAVVTKAEEYQPSESKYSILNWIKGLAAELGIGFGWAALYFTALTGLFKGQTIGKKLLGIKIIKLDGSAMSTWESFGRYGGYGAGIATGLLGFLQIFWDPNRQAIQDKISETLVINTRKPHQTNTNNGSNEV